MLRLFAVLLLVHSHGLTHAADKSRPRSLDPALKIELFAEHPKIVTPTGIDVDYKGRVFAIESNTHFPPTGYKGHKTDRVLVLEDTTGNGKADRVTVFTDGLTHTMSVAVKPLWLGGRGRKSGGGRRKAGGGGRKAGVGRQAASRQASRLASAGGGASGGRGQKSEDRSQKTGGGRRKAGGRNQKSAVRGQNNRRRGKPLTTHHSPITSVYLATRRDIWLYHDDNGDLKADRRQRIIKLETRGNYPHNGLAGLAFDAMGWMYFGFGENLGAKYTIIGSDGKKLTGGGEGGNLYRCRPDGSKLTRWATGFWNPHASCVDAFGRVFTVDNDADSRPPCRLLHIIEGGDYGFRYRNGRKGLHPFTAWNGEIPGTLPMVSGTGEAPSGIVAYESDGLPKKYIGNLLVGSWGDHRIDRFVLKPKGASFVSRPQTIIQGGEDFRPVGLAVAPDGSLFCTDWVKRDYKLHGHGRVWRISRKKEAKRKVIDLTTITPKRPVKELGKLLSHARLDVRRMAVKAYSDIGTREAGRTLVQIVRSPNCTVRARIEIIWKSFRKNSVFKKLPATSFTTGQEFPAYIEAMAQSIDTTSNTELKRGFGLLALSFLFIHDKSVVVNQHTRTAKLAAQNSFGWIGGFRHFDFSSKTIDQKTVRGSFQRFIASADAFQIAAMLREMSTSPSKKVGTEYWRSLLKEFSVNSEVPARVRFFSVLSLRRQTPFDTAIVQRALNDSSPDVRRAAVQWVAEENLKQLQPQVAAVLNGKVMNTDLFLATLAALEMLDGKSPKDFDRTPAGKYVLPLVRDPKRPAAVRAQALRLVDAYDLQQGRTGRIDTELMNGLLKSPDAALRREAVRTLAESPWKGTNALLLRVARNRRNDVNLRADALLGLSPSTFSNSRETKTLERFLVSLLKSKEPALRVEALRALRGPAATDRARRQAVIQVLQALSGKGKDRPEIVEQAVFTLSTKKAEVPAELSKLKPNRPASIADWYKYATAGGDAPAGRRVFFHINSAGCYKCHTVNGRGGKIGPDLTYIARTANRRKLAESILEPAKEIAPQFTLWSFVMQSGKVHHGMILGDTRDKKQRIGTPEGTIVTLPTGQIELRTAQRKSVMPDKLIDRLTMTEFRDLLAFLETLK